MPDAEGRETVEEAYVRRTQARRELKRNPLVLAAMVGAGRAWTGLCEDLAGTEVSNELQVRYVNDHIRATVADLTPHEKEALTQMALANLLVHAGIVHVDGDYLCTLLQRRARG